MVKASTINTNQDLTHGYKKRGDWLLPVPRSEALRLPCSQEQATRKTPRRYAQNLFKKRMVLIHTHGHLPLQCPVTVE